MLEHSRECKGLGASNNLSPRGKREGGWQIWAKDGVSRQGERFARKRSRWGGGGLLRCQGSLPPRPPGNRTPQARLRGRKDRTDGIAAGSGEDYLF